VRLFRRGCRPRLEGACGFALPGGPGDRDAGAKEGVVDGGKRRRLAAAGAGLHQRDPVMAGDQAADCPLLILPQP
jgi:hypothetical protein